MIDSYIFFKVIFWSYATFGTYFFYLHNYSDSVSDTCSLPVLAHSGDHSGCRAACYGYGRNFWPVCEGLPPAWQEEEIRDQGPQEDPQPRLQRAVHLQGRPRFESQLRLVLHSFVSGNLLLLLAIWFACSLQIWEGVETATSWRFNKLLTEYLTHTQLYSHTLSLSEAGRDWF